MFDTFQIPYSALERQHEDLIGAAADSGAGVIVRGGVARGEPGSRSRRRRPLGRLGSSGLDDLRDEGESRTGFLLRFTNSHPGMSTNIVGTKSVEHLLENIAAAARGPLADDVYAEAKRRLGAAG